MRIGFILFVTIASLLVAALHFGVLISIIKFFQIGPGLMRKTLSWSIGILAFSFITTSFLVMWKENLLTRIPYIISAAWLGMFIYVLMAAAAAWVLIAFVRMFGIGLDSAYIASPLLAIAVLVSIYGYWNAAHPITKNLSVTIEGLPSQWKGRTIMHVTDTHLGAIRRSGFCNKVVRLINDASPDIVMITGDLFDGGGRDLRGLVEPLNKIKAPLGVYFVTGNHETYVGLDRCLDAIKSTPLRVLRDEIIEVEGIQILGIDYPTMGQQNDLRGLFDSLSREKPCIALFHEPRFVDTLKQMRVDLQLAGHTHKGQQWPFNYITRRVYNGLDYGLHKDGNYHLYTSCGAGTWGPPLRLGNRPEVVAIRLE